MPPDRKDAWLLIFAAFCQVWTWLEPTADRIRVWDGALADLSPDELRRGAAYVLANHSGSQPPTPGELRDAAQGELTRCAVRSDGDGRIIRWEKKRIHPREKQPAPLGVLGQADHPQLSLR
jgi:hypothetical protein